MAAVPPTRIEGRLGREGLTRHEANSTPHVQSPQERGAQQRRETVRSLPSRDTGSARERRVRRIQEAETITGRVRREANPLADATRMYATKSNAHQERSGRDKKRQKKCSKGLDKCGHIEGLYGQRRGRPLQHVARGLRSPIGRCGQNGYVPGVERLQPEACWIQRAISWVIFVARGG